MFYVTCKSLVSPTAVSFESISVVVSFGNAFGSGMAVGWDKSGVGIYFWLDFLALDTLEFCNPLFCLFSPFYQFPVI